VDFREVEDVETEVMETVVLGAVVDVETAEEEEETEVREVVAVARKRRVHGCL